MNKFKKYLLCLLFSILAINFIVSANSFFTSLSQYLIPSQIKKDPNNDSLVSIGKNLEETLENTIYELTETHGEDYPALGIMYYQTISHYSSVTLVQNFIFSLIGGFTLGNIIFFIFFAKLKSPYILFLSLVLVLFVTAFFLSLSDILTYIANSEEIAFSLSEIFWNMEVWVIPYTIICLVLCAVQKIYTVYKEIQNS